MKYNVVFETQFKIYDDRSALNFNSCFTVCYPKISCTFLNITYDF